MSYTTTPHLGLLKPTDMNDVDQWGVHLNTDMDLLDSSIGGLAATYITTVPSIAALRMLTTGVTVVVVQGYYAPSDGGGGTYVKSAVPATDNGVTIIVSGAGTYYLQTAGRPITAKQAGARGNGASDDTAALQAAINAATNGELYIPAGSYLTTGVTASGLIKFTGAGKFNTTLILTTNGTIGISVTGNAPVELTDFGITPASGITGTTGIKVSPTSGENSESIFRDLQLINLAMGIDTERASYVTIDNVDVLQFKVYGVRIRNISNADSGDSTILNCLFSADAAASGNLVGVQQFSSGGLKIVGCKFLAGYYGYSLVLEAGVATGDLVITGCSLEGQTGASISVNQFAAGGTFHSIEITGCQFNLTAQAVSVLNSFATPGWVSDVCVSGGSMWINANGVGIDLDGVNGFSIDGVDFHALGTNVGCINIRAGSSDGLISPMQYTGATIASFVQNTGTRVTVQPRVQSGTGTVSTASAYGALFFGSGTNISFPVPYLNPPRVRMTPTSNSTGAVSAFPIAVAAGSFTPAVVGTLNTSAVAFTWTAEGN